MKKTISWMLVCLMTLGMAAVSCTEEDPTDKPGDNTENTDGPGENTDGPGENTDQPKPRTLVVKYTGNENMKDQFVNFGLWTPELKAESNWKPGDYGYGQFNAENEAEYDKSLLASLKDGDKIWICIEKVVKYFHTVTAEELAAGVINLPDKDGGCTLLPEPTLGGKPYVNDWVVALYMGVDAWSTRPLYWATGNLIAVKTGAAGAPTEPAFYLATLEETAQEALGGGKNPYNAYTDGHGEEFSKTDGYTKCEQGYRWDCFMPVDGTGIRTDFKDTPDEYVLKTMKYMRANVMPADNINWAFGGFDGYDLATTQLGGAWSIPDRFDPAVALTGPGTPIDKAVAAKGGKLGELIYKTDRTSGVWNDGADKMYWRVIYQTEGGFENTILLPAGAMRRDRGGKLTADEGHRVVVMASGVVAGQSNFMAFDTFAPEGIEVGTGYNNHYEKFINIRPVTE